MSSVGRPGRAAVQTTMSLPTPSEIAELLLDLGKATFDNTYDSIATFQVTLEGGATGLVHRATWLPGELTSLVDECIGFLRRTRVDFKGTVDRCYLLLSELVGTELPSAGPAAVDADARPPVSVRARGARRGGPTRRPHGSVAPVVQ